MSECWCCDGRDRGDPFAMCDTCIGAILRGEFPHGCDRPTPTRTETSDD